ncbi:hypothetical protein [Nocardia sp. NPDC052112]|uniref:PPE domain-containing protein n=1 Tax=Nocardia sp. NPDC052112 TaxID=3155646 RepID=UPI003424F33B
MPHTGEKTPIRYADPNYTDPNYAQTVEIFDNLSHREIHDGVQLMNPVVLAAGQQAWQGSSTGLATAVEQAHSEIRAAMADGWRGAAADSAADAVREFERHGQQLADVMAAVGQRLGQAGDAAEALRAAVVEPSGETTDLAGALLDPTKATENAATQKAADGTRLDVVQAMDSIYTNAFISTGSGVPAFPDAALPYAVGAEVPQPSDSAPVAPISTTPILDIGAQTVTTPTVSASTPLPTTPPTTVEPAAATTQPATAPTTVTPVSTVADTTSAAVEPVAPTADSSASTTPAAATTTPDRTVRPGTAAAPVTTAASTSVVTPTVPGTSTTDDERKRDERKRDASGDAINGVGAGAVGGLMGGAMVAGDSPRSGMSTSAAAARAQARDEDEYDDYHFFDDDLTFLEPADDGGELIGDMDPTTPPVVGEWTELE